MHTLLQTLTDYSNNTIHLYSQIILKWAYSLRSTNPFLKVEPQPFHIITISHPRRKVRRTRVGLINNLLRTPRRCDIAPGAPHTTGLLRVAQKEVVQQFSALRVRGILQDGACLRPSDKGTFGRQHRVVAGSEVEGVSGCKGGYNLAIDGVDKRLGSSCTAEPAGVVCKESIKPFVAEVGILEPVGGQSKKAWREKSVQLTKDRIARAPRHRRWGR